MSTEENNTEETAASDLPSVGLVGAAKQSVGALFKAAREAQHMSVADVAHHLKLSPSQVEALEADEHDKLPGAVFVRGFIRNYARLLGIDATPLLAPVETRKAAVPQTTDTVPASKDIPFPEKAGIPWHIYGIVIAILVIPVLIFQLFYRNQPVDDATTVQSSAVTLPTPQVVSASEPAVTQTTASQVTEAQSEMPATEEKKQTEEMPALEKKPEMPASSMPVAPQAANKETTKDKSATKESTGVVEDVIGGSDDNPSDASASKSADDKSLDSAMSEQMLKHLKTATVEATDGTHALTLTFDEDSWTEVYDARGQNIFWQLGKAGTTRHVSGIAPLVLVIGNAHSVHLSVDGKPLDLAPYTRTDVARFKLQ